MPKRVKPDYSVGLIRRLLEGYAELEEGRNPLERSNNPPEYSVPSILKSPLGNRNRNMPQILKADIDRAIQALRPRQKFVVLCCDIDCRNPQDVAFWLGGTIKDIIKWEDEAVRFMSNYLGGKTSGSSTAGGDRIQQ